MITWTNKGGDDSCWGCLACFCSCCCHNTVECWTYQLSWTCCTRTKEGSTILFFLNWQWQQYGHALQHIVLLMIILPPSLVPDFVILLLLHCQNHCASSTIQHNLLDTRCNTYHWWECSHPHWSQILLSSSSFIILRITVQQVSSETLMDTRFQPKTRHLQLISSLFFAQLHYHCSCSCSSKSRFSLLRMGWLILVRTSHQHMLLILWLSLHMGSISDQEPVGRQETCKQQLFWLGWAHVRPMKVVLKVDSHCWRWNGWSWYARDHDTTHDFMVVLHCD